VGSEDPLYPSKGAWRAFEHGSRNCIGQILAMTEIKMIVVLVLREFDGREAYEEWDGVGKGKGMAKRARGERAYQVTGGGGGQHPADRYPCRVQVRGE
jgi:hypothetical protein